MNEKLKQTILYMLNKYGPMSLEKIEGLLYFIDFDYYEKHERPFFEQEGWNREIDEPSVLYWVRGKNRPELRVLSPSSSG